MTTEITPKADAPDVLTWECLQEDFAYRAEAPLFGSIRVERYSPDAQWEINWSVPGYSEKLVKGSWPTAEAAMRAASDHVSAVMALAPGASPQPTAAEVAQARARVVESLDHYASYSEEERLRARLSRLEGYLEQISHIAGHQRGLSTPELESKLSQIFLLSECVPDVDLEQDIAFMEGERARTMQALANETVI